MRREASTLMSSDGAAAAPRGAAAAAAARPAEIRVEGVHKSFGDNHVLRGIDLTILRGEMVAIVGASGGGKTVLLKLMIGHTKPDRGRVMVADHESPDSRLADLSTLDDEQMDRLRQHWAVVFQKNALFTGSVYDNIALGLLSVKRMNVDDARRRASDMLNAVGLDPRRVLDLSREELSGGMAKRVAIARALALDPALIFYDEPTTGLDPGNAAHIQDLVRSVHAKKPDVGAARTTVIVTHDTALIYRLEPRVVMLHEGRVFFDGRAREFEDLDSPVTRPYREMMPVLHRRAVLAEREECFR